MCSDRDGRRRRSGILRDKASAGSRAAKAPPRSGFRGHLDVSRFDELENFATVRRAACGVSGQRDGSGHEHVAGQTLDRDRRRRFKSSGTRPGLDPEPARTRMAVIVVPWLGSTAMS